MLEWEMKNEKKKKLPVKKIIPQEKERLVDLVIMIVITIIEKNIKHNKELKKKKK